MKVLLFERDFEFHTWVPRAAYVVTGETKSAYELEGFLGLRNWVCKEGIGYRCEIIKESQDA